MTLLRPLVLLALATAGSLGAIPQKGHAQEAAPDGTIPETIPGPSNATDDPKAAPDGVDIKLLMRGLPRRVKIGRIRGLRVVSTVTFTGAPEAPHKLTLTAAFPDRSRLVLSSPSGTLERFQLGTTLFGRDNFAQMKAEERASFVLDGQGRDETELDLALRRAAFLWPDGARFAGEGATRTAKVGTAGQLVATLDGQTGRPTEIRALDRNGERAGRLQKLTWREQSGRWWPKTLEFALPDGVLWSETVLSVQDKWLFNDAWFLPVDRVGELLGHRIEKQVQIRVQRATFVHRSKLQAPTSIDTAFEQARALWDRKTRNRANARGALAVVLDVKNRPAAIEIELWPRSPDDRSGSSGSDRGESVDGDISDDRLSPGGDWSKRAGTNVWTNLLEGADVDVAVAAAQLREVAERSRSAGGADPRSEVLLRVTITRSEKGAPTVGARTLVTAAVTVAEDPDAESKASGTSPAADEDPANESGK